MKTIIAILSLNALLVTAGVADPGRGRGPGAPMADLSEEEREKLAALHDRVHEDAAVQKAREELDDALKKYRETRRKVARDIDPEAAELAESVWRDRMGPGKDGKQGYRKFSREERQKLREVRRKAMEDPQLQKQQETLRRERQEMWKKHRAHREALHAKMLEIDPSVEPLLEEAQKWREHKRGKRGRKQG